MNAPGSRLAGWTVALGSTLAFSIAAPIGALVFQAGTDPTTLIAARLLLTTVLLFATLLIFAPQRLRIDRNGLRVTFGVGLVTGASQLLFFWSLTRLGASIATMMFSIHPLLVLGLLALRGETFTHRNVLRLALALGGVYLLVGAGGPADGLGLLLVAGAVIASSLQTVFIQWYLQEYDGLTVTFYMVAGMATVAVAWYFVPGAQWAAPTWPAWAGIVALAVISTYLARVAMFAAIRRFGSSQVALLVPLETMLTVVWSTLFLGERLTWLQVLGSALILSSAAMAIRRLGRVVRWPPRWRTWWRL